MSIIARINLMVYAENANTHLNLALKLFNSFCGQGSVSKIEQKKFCIAAEKYLANFNSWYSCSPVEAKAYQIFVRSTPLSPMLELPQSEWLNWLEKNIPKKNS